MGASPWGETEGQSVRGKPSWETGDPGGDRGSSQGAGDGSRLTDKLNDRTWGPIRQGMWDGGLRDWGRGTQTSPKF